MTRYYNKNLKEKITKECKKYAINITKEKYKESKYLLVQVRAMD